MLFIRAFSCFYAARKLLVEDYQWRRHWILIRYDENNNEIQILINVNRKIIMFGDSLNIVKETIRERIKKFKIKENFFREFYNTSP